MLISSYSIGISFSHKYELEDEVGVEGYNGCV